MTTNISDYVNVKQVPSVAKASFSIGHCAIFTEEASTLPIQNNIIRFNRLSNVKEYFDVNSKTVKIATSFFNAYNSAMENDGSLVVVPLLNSTSGSAKSITTLTLTTNLANFIAISDGSITINSILVEKLNFTKVITEEDVFTVIEKGIIKAGIQIGFSYNSVNKTISFVSPNIGSDSTLTVTAGTTGTNITGASLLNIAGATTVNGTNATQGETLADAITRVFDESFSAFTTTLLLDINQVISNENLVRNLQLPASRPSTSYKVFVYNVPNIADATLVNTTLRAIETSDFPRMLLYTGLLPSDKELELIGSTMSEIASISYKNDIKRTLSAKQLNIDCTSYEYAVNSASLSTLLNAGINTYNYMNSTNSFGYLYSGINKYSPEETMFLLEFPQTLQILFYNAFAENAAITENNVSIFTKIINEEIAIALANNYLSTGKTATDLSGFKYTTIAKNEIFKKGGYAEIGTIANRNVTVRYSIALSQSIYTATINHQL